MRNLKFLMPMFLIVILITSCSLSSPSDDAVNNNTSTEDSKSISNNSKDVKQDSESKNDTSSIDAVVVEFECSELERLVREALNLETGDILSTNMLELYNIRPNGDNVKSLKGLEYAKNLENFGVLRNEIPLKSLKPISHLDALKRITVSYTDITEPVELGKLNQVNTLNFIDTNISDISSLNGLTALENLTLLDSDIESIEGIKELKNLKKVHLRGNKIQSIEALRGKNKLKELNLQGNKVTDLEPLSGLESLEILNLSYNPVTNLKPLEDLPSLTKLTIYLDHDEKHKIFDQVDLLESNGIIVESHR